jgi:ankyrin repeat protein
MMAAAARGGPAEMIDVLYRDGRFDIDGLSMMGRNAMSYAAEAGHVEIIQKLLEVEEEEAGRVKWNVVSRMGLRPLDYARRGGKAAVVELLTKHYSPGS